MARTYQDPDRSYQTCRSTSLPRGASLRKLLCTWANLPQGITKVRTIRRSARLQQQRARQALVPHDSGGLDAGVVSPTTQPSAEKRKRATSDQPVRKRQRLSSTTAHEEIRCDVAESSDPIDYWRKNQRWPQAFFEPENNMIQRYSERSSSSIPRKTSTSSATSSDASKEKNKKRYHMSTFKVLLQNSGSFLGEYTNGPESGPLKTSSDLCENLFTMPQDVPKDSLFSDEFFVRTCEMVEDRGEAKVVQDISRLIVPSAEALAIRGSKHLDILIESVSDTWARSIPVHRDFPQPKPDFSVGFRWSAFTSGQLEKLYALCGSISDRSATPYTTTRFMCFPFLTCEAKCGAAALDDADRQNAHSATIAVRNIVGLFKLVKRELELNREILVFSVSHDHNAVRIYGHYPVFDGETGEARYYRHKMMDGAFTRIGGKDDRWAAYKFTKNVYDNWMPNHFKRICTAIDDIPPDISFDVSELRSSTNLSLELESQHPPQSERSVSLVDSHDESSIAGIERTTPDTSVSPSFKKPKRIHRD